MGVLNDDETGKSSRKNLRTSFIFHETFFQEIFIYSLDSLKKSFYSWHKKNTIEILKIFNTDGKFKKFSLLTNLENNQVSEIV